MPFMPWTATGPFEPGHVYLVMATRFTVKSPFRMGSVVMSTRHLWSDISDVEGLAGYSLRSDVVRGTLATLTAWRDAASLALFVRNESHAALVAETRPRMHASAFASWEMPGAELPPRWDEAARRLDAAH